MQIMPANPTSYLRNNGIEDEGEAQMVKRIQGYKIADGRVNLSTADGKSTRV